MSVPCTFWMGGAAASRVPIPHQFGPPRTDRSRVSGRTELTLTRIRSLCVTSWPSLARGPQRYGRYRAIRLNDLDQAVQCPRQPMTDVAAHRAFGPPDLSGGRRDGQRWAGGPGDEPLGDEAGRDVGHRGSLSASFGAGSVTTSAPVRAALLARRFVWLCRCALASPPARAELILTVKMAASSGIGRSTHSHYATGCGMVRAYT